LDLASGPLRHEKAAAAELDNVNRRRPVGDNQACYVRCAVRPFLETKQMNTAAMSEAVRGASKGSDDFPSLTETNNGGSALNMYSERANAAQTR